MLIPPSRDSDGVAWPDTDIAPILPHGYLYPLEVASIHRILRPIKGKIAAIRRDIKSSPSLRFFLEEQVSLEKTTEQATESRRSQRRRATMKRELRQERHQQTQSTKGSRNRPSKPPPFQPEGDNSLAESNTRAVGILVKRYQASLASLFKDALNRLWWRPFCDNNDLPINNMPCTKNTKAVRQQHSSLAIVCAFSAGQTLSHVTDEKKMELYYESIPPHLRRFAVLSHLVEICVCQIPIPQLKFHLAEICVKYRADDQALRFLDDLLQPSKSAFFRLDLLRAYQLVQATDISDAWVELVSKHGACLTQTSASLGQLIHHAEKRHQTLLARTLIDLVVANSSTEGLHLVAVDQQIMTRWVVSLIADSLVINNPQSEDPSIYFEEHECPSSQCDEAIAYMARTLYTHPEAMTAAGLEQIALALGLHTLYLLFIADTQLPAPHDDMILEWTLLIDERTKKVQEDDLDVVLRAFKTIPNLLVLVQVLDATELYSLAMTLLDRMIDDFSHLNKTTHALLGETNEGSSVTVRSLESMIDEIEQRRLAAAAASGWLFDHQLGHWVQQDESHADLVGVERRTSDYDLSILSDSENDQNDSTDSKIARSKTQCTPRNNRRLSLFSTASPRKPPSAFKRRSRPYISLEDEDGSAIEEDPAPLDFPLTSASSGQDLDWPPTSRRFSMAPYRRPVRSTRKQICYFDSGDDSESIPPNAETPSFVMRDTSDEDEVSRLQQLSDSGEADSVDAEDPVEAEEVESHVSDAGHSDDLSSEWHFGSTQRPTSDSASIGSLSSSRTNSWSREEAKSLDGEGSLDSFSDEWLASPKVAANDTLKSSSSSSNESEEESEVWLPPRKLWRRESRLQQRRGEKRKAVAYDDNWTSTDDSASNSSLSCSDGGGSDGEYRPWTKRGAQSSRGCPRRKRRLHPMVESSQTLNKKFSSDGDIQVDVQQQWQTRQAKADEGLVAQPPIEIGDVHSVAQDDESTDDLGWAEPEEGTLAEMDAQAELVERSFNAAAMSEVEAEADGGVETDRSVSGGDGEADDGEWLPPTRRSRHRFPRRDPSPQRDQQLLLAVGEPLPLTEADELAF